MPRTPCTMASSTRSCSRILKGDVALASLPMLGKLEKRKNKARTAHVRGAGFSFLPIGSTSIGRDANATLPLRMDARAEMRVVGFFYRRHGGFGKRGQISRRGVADFLFGRFGAGDGARHRVKAQNPAQRELNQRHSLRADGL